MAKIGIIGLGNMGEAIMRALLDAGRTENEIISFEIRASRREAISRAYAIEIADSLEQVIKQSGYIILAVKPQDAKGVLHSCAPFIDESRIVISVMAGITTSTIVSMIEKPAKVVRIMPNICVKVSQGAMGMTANYLLTEQELESVKQLLKPLGLIVEVGEEHMDAVTGLSGSGPAFFLSFVEAMIDGGVKMGLPRDKAHALAIQTIKGTIEMLEKEKLHPTLMKEMITSPGGTTIAGLVVLDDRGFKGNVIRALVAAQTRSKELSK
jgi:pyrroline-5-carboxylate reductase